MNDTRTIALITSVLALLTAATAVGQFLKRHPDRGLDLESAAESYYRHYTAQ